MKVPMSGAADDAGTAPGYASSAPASPPWQHGLPPVAPKLEPPLQAAHPAALHSPHTWGQVGPSAPVAGHRHPALADPGLSGGHPDDASSLRSAAVSQVDIDPLVLDGLPPQSQIEILQQRLAEVTQRNSRFRSENARLRMEQESLREKVGLFGDQRELQDALHHVHVQLGDERREHSLRKIECEELRARLELLHAGLRRAESRDSAEVEELRALLEDEHSQDMRACSDYYEGRLQQLRDRLDQSESARQHLRDHTDALQCELDELYYTKDTVAAGRRAVSYPRHHTTRRSRGVQREEGGEVVAGSERKRSKVRKGGAKPASCDLCEGCLVQ